MLAPQTVSTADTVVLPKPKGGPTDGFDAKQNSSIQETGWDFRLDVCRSQAMPPGDEH